jgi:hypothetical protein
VIWKLVAAELGIARAFLEGAHVVRLCPPPSAHMNVVGWRPNRAVRVQKNVERITVELTVEHAGRHFDNIVRVEKFRMQIVFWTF